jgi:hypothetical protein
MFSPPIAVYLLPVYLCLLCLLVYPVYYPSKRVYVYLLLFTTMVNVFTFTAKEVNCLLCLKTVYFGEYCKQFLIYYWALSKRDLSQRK